jgi:ABC-type nickel/cobalt efflux system permease component RcnA
MLDSLIQFPLVFGVLAAALHVLTGPDHLAAIAPIALRTRFRPWMIGMSWGVGHLLGMLILGGLFFFFRELIPIEMISANSERIVGLLLIIIGLWSIYRIYTYKKTSPHKHVHTHKDEHGNVYVHTHGHEHSGETKHSHTGTGEHRQTYFAVLGIGLLHGLAGFNHILHLLPTLAFPSAFDAILYLAGFAVGTVLAMVGFSIILGLAGRISNQAGKEVVFKTVNIVAGFGAIGIGLFWLWNTW